MQVGQPTFSRKKVGFGYIALARGGEERLAHFLIDTAAEVWYNNKENKTERKKYNGTRKKRY